MHVRLTKRSRSFRNTSLIQTGLSDSHKIMVSVFRTLLNRPPAKVIEYQNYNIFDHNEFLRNLDQELIKSSLYNNE